METPYKIARKIFYLGEPGVMYEVTHQVVTAMYRVRKRSKIKKKFKSKTINGKIYLWQEI